jgi:16S rRNA (guanine527-N7)-methyltransferase
MKQLREAFEQLNIEASEDAILKFEKHMSLVLEWNKKVNLTTITNEADFIQKHFIDSILCVCFDEFKRADTVIDVGTGAGFPGVPLAILFPQKQFLLVDSVSKKLKILKEILEDLEIANVNLIHTRAEDLAHDKKYRENFDICVSRAVSNLATLSEYCLPFVKTGGTFIAYKGPDVTAELEKAGSAIRQLGGETGEIRRAELAGFELDHNMVFINKKKKTPAGYPRKAGVPAKEPLL